ncbi:tyrosine-type recombinase/integrase [Comamonadaceae bacterium G21597-S1]|nr:tyrosine-type recombinase/integrase [Comamonadaceae bacterium G21597-S1]
MGVRPLTRNGGTQVYQVAFSFMGVQCREVIARPHSKSNLAYCTSLRSEILGKIARGEFIYTDYFPDSNRAALFGHGTGKARTIRLVLEAYRDRTKSTLEASTWNPYRRDIENILVPRWGHMRLTQFTSADLRLWVGEQNLSLKRIRNILLPLRAVFDEAVEDGVLKTNPVAINLKKLVPIDKRTSDFKPSPYTVAELRTLLSNVPEPVRWAFQLWAFTGLRTGELVGLRWPRIDLVAKTIRVTETTTERVDKPRAKTAAGLRTIELLPAAIEAIQRMREHTQMGNDRFTVNPRGRRKDKAWDTNKLADAWERAHKGTGIVPRNPYQLRHTFASQLLSQGENPAFIAKLLGHKTIEMVTRTYGRWVSEGEKLGFDRPPRRYGMEPLWAGAKFTHNSHTAA